MAKNYSVNWRILRDHFGCAAGYVIDRKKRFIALGVGGVLAFNGYSAITSPEFAEHMAKRRQAQAEQKIEMQQFAAPAQVRGPGQAAIPVGALTYLFDFNTKKVILSGEGGTQEVSFDSVYTGELAKKVKEVICNDTARRERFGLHYCQQ